MNSNNLSKLFGPKNASWVTQKIIPILVLLLLFPVLCGGDWCVSAALKVPIMDKSFRQDPFGITSMAAASMRADPITFLGSLG